MFGGFQVQILRYKPVTQMVSLVIKLETFPKVDRATQTMKTVRHGRDLKQPHLFNQSHSNLRETYRIIQLMISSYCMILLHHHTDQYSIFTDIYIHTLQVIAYGFSMASYCFVKYKHNKIHCSKCLDYLHQNVKH